MIDALTIYFPWIAGRYKDVWAYPLEGIVISSVFGAVNDSNFPFS